MAETKYQFHTDLPGRHKNIRKVIERKLKKLNSWYDAILEADINMDAGEKDETPYNVKTTVLLKTKIKKFVATKIDKRPLVSLRTAFDAAEAQLKKTEEKLSHPWEIHDAKAKLNNKTS